MVKISEEFSLREHIARDVLSIRGVSLMATFVGLVFLSTSLFYIAIASSTGFFNLGEVFIFLAAFIGGPVTGAVAGGVGASLADLALGYGIFAPATLVLKAAEGFVAGYLFYLAKKVRKSIKFTFLSLITAFLLGFSVYFVHLSFDFGIDFYGRKSFEFSIPGFVLLLIAIVLSSLLWIAALIFEEKGDMAISCVIAGSIIVIGYFLYEILIIDIPVAGAVIEIPFNIAQVLFGLATAIPIVMYLRDLGIIKREKGIEKDSSVKSSEEIENSDKT